MEQSFSLPTNSSEVGHHMLRLNNLERLSSLMVAFFSPEPASEELSCSSEHLSRLIDRYDECLVPLFTELWLNAAR